MAPDLNSVPPSPHSILDSSRSSMASSSRVSQPTMSSSTLGNSTNSESAITSQGSTANTAAQAVDPGPGPSRHPRPLTAAELHLELEKENEAVVNRLGRELSLLRHRSASVASSNSTTSNGPQEATALNHGNAFGPVSLTMSRQHRSSSNLGSQNTNFSGLGVSTVSSIAPARDTMAGPALNSAHSSRHNSINARRGDAISPSHQSDSHPAVAAARLSRLPSTLHSTTTGTLLHDPIISLPDSVSVGEVAQHRAEWEHVRQENEVLRQRVRELERELNRELRPAVGTGSTLNEGI